METNAYARWFRGSTPYISAHRGKTFVVLLPGEAQQHANITNIVHDLALLHVLGVRLVLVHGARPQIEQALPESFYHQNRRVTDASAMSTITAINGQLRAGLEALFSTGLPNTPLHNVDIPVVAGNFVTAQPFGIVDGVDHLFTGSVRRIQTRRVTAALDSGALVLQSPMGYSPSGQIFNLAAAELAAHTATALQADKLIALSPLSYLGDKQGERVSTVTPAGLDQYAASAEPEAAADLQWLGHAVTEGVAKAHLVSYIDDGALLAELFTAEGVGTQILPTPRRGIRPAELEDVTDIVEMIRPLEEAGVLVRRERDRLEQEIGNFLVAAIDGVVVGCCAVYTYDNQAELACVAVHENYRNATDLGIGRTLLEAAERHARQEGAEALFALTTQTKDWFIDQGFAEASPDTLPERKQSLYNWQRNSAVMRKPL